MIDISKKVAVISGGSSGIGFEIARILQSKGYILHLIARGRKKLEEAKINLPNNIVHIHEVDVSNKEAIDLCVDYIISNDSRIDWLITCAGTAEPSLFLETHIESHINQMNANYFGSLYLIHKIAPIMKEQGRKNNIGGMITLISSALAFGGVAGYSAYGASKFAIRGLAEALIVELSPFGIKVSVAYPPDTQTPLLDKEELMRPEITKKIAKGGGRMLATDVAKDIVYGAEKGKFQIVSGNMIKLYSYLSSLINPILRWQHKRWMQKIGNKKGLDQKKKDRSQYG